jgi:DHA1 family quinolone resistance protein-like MFS transporter
MKSLRSIERRYALILFLFWFSTALPMALFILLAQARGMSLAQLGLLTAIYSATIFLLEVPTGGLADAWGRRRVALLGEAVTLAGWGIFLVSFSFPSFLVAFLLNGVGRALASGTLEAWFVDSLQAIRPDVDLHPRLSRTGAVAFVALGLGAVCGGAIARGFSFLPADGTAILTPLASPGLVAIVLRLGLMAAIALLVREPEDRFHAASWRRGIAEVPKLLKEAVRLTASSRILVRLLAVAGASGLVLSSLELLWQPQFGRLLGEGEARSVFLGAILAGSFLMGVVGNLVAPRLSKRLGGRPGRICAIFHGLRGALLVGLAVQGHAAPAAVLFWLVYLGQGAVNSTHALLLNEEIPSHRRSSMLSIESLTHYVGGFIGSAGLGFVAQRTSIGIAWGIAGTVLLVSWVLYLRVDSVREERRRGQRVVTRQAAATSDAR